MEDAYSMLLESVALDDPVIFCEHKFLYRRIKEEIEPGHIVIPDQFFDRTRQRRSTFFGRL